MSRSGSPPANDDAAALRILALEAHLAAQRARLAQLTGSPGVPAAAPAGGECVAEVCRRALLRCRNADGMVAELLAETSQFQTAATATQGSFAPLPEDLPPLGVVPGDSNADAPAAAPSSSFLGVPERPFYVRFAHEIVRYAEHHALDSAAPPPSSTAVRAASAALAHRFAGVPGLEDDADVAAGVAAAIDSQHTAIGLLASALRAGNDVTAGVVLDRFVLTGLGWLGVARFLGVRLTKGTVDAVAARGLLPPSAGELYASFNVLYPKSKLSVGGKALAKHTVRTASWWGGDLKGSEYRKSLNAYTKVREIVSTAAWMNLHMLPHGLPTFEVRLAEGYGARWVVEEHGVLKFRGFLEPQMADGHEKGWRH